ncbi:site-specific DNA-methyltransferase [Candidatus Pacearchaeota archaeon]|nr:site-specific DNA-methyltransferase [Candidatus Pacearchaeota archaeon]
MVKPYYQDDKYDITIYHGDCLEIMPGLKMVNFVYADPPYGVGKADWDKEYFTGWELLSVNKTYNGMVANVGTKAICACMAALGDEYKDLFYGWNKNGMTRSSIGFMNVLIAVVAGKVKMGQNFCQFVIKDLSRKNHPSPKPVEYIRCVLKRFTDMGDTVLDPFVGSGTTLVAAKELGRKAIGIEIEEKYCEIAVRRLSQNTFQFNEPMTKICQSDMKQEQKTLKF